MTKLNRKLALTFLALLLTFAASASAPVYADNLSLQPGFVFGSCAPVNITSGAATATCPPTGLPELTVTTVAMGDLSTGVFGASAFVSDSGGTGFGSGADVGSSYQVTYLFTVSGTTDGTAQFALSLDGILTSTECSQGVTCAPGTGPMGAEIETADSYTINGAAGPLGGTALAAGLTNIVISAPITNGVSELQFFFNVGASCSGSAACTTSADFLDPLTINGATVLDTDGNLVSGATLVSESGFNPNAGGTTPPTSMPEPSSALLLGTSLFGLLGAARKKLSS